MRHVPLRGVSQQGTVTSGRPDRCTPGARPSVGHRRCQRRLPSATHVHSARLRSVRRQSCLAAQPRSCLRASALAAAPCRRRRRRAPRTHRCARRHARHRLAARPGGSEGEGRRQDAGQLWTSAASRRLSRAMRVLCGGSHSGMRAPAFTVHKGPCTVSTFHVGGSLQICELAGAVHTALARRQAGTTSDGRRGAMPSVAVTAAAGGCGRARRAAAGAAAAPLRERGGGGRRERA